MLRTVRTKLIALVLTSTLTSGLSAVVVGWMLWREIEETSREGVERARVGITHGIEDDIGGLFVTARALATCCANALATGGELPREQMEHVVGVLMDSFQDEHVRVIAPNGDVVVSYRANADTHEVESDPTAGTHVDVAALHTGIDRLGCAGSEGLALRVVWEIEDGGGYLVEDCSPYTQPRLQEESRSLHLPLALVDGDGHGLSVQTDGFPSDLVPSPPADPRLVTDGDHVWIAAHFEAAPPTGDGTVPVVAAFDITKEVANLRRTALAAIALMGLATLVALLFGWRIARRMSGALTRVSHAHKKIADQEYVHVRGVKTGDELEDLANGFNAMVDGLKERDKLKTTFGKYMTPSIVEHLMAGKVQLGGESLEVSILFSDIRDFTSISERMDAHELVALLNEYFTEMVTIVIDEGGVVDKYIGDAIMAVFGAPVPGSDDALRAVRAAVRMRTALIELNERLEKRGKPLIKTGIGIHTGVVVAGNIGSESRMEYTVIGDTVNLASRLEGKTKELGVGLVVSEDTFAKVEGQVVARRLSEITVKGREKPVVVYEVTAMDEKADAPPAPAEAPPTDA